MRVYIAYANLNTFDTHSTDKDFTNIYLPKCVKLLDLSKDKLINQRRKLAYYLLWKLGKNEKEFRDAFKKIYYDQLGRPQIPSDRFDFNISHSGSWIAVIFAVSDSHKPKVSIDIETPKIKFFLPILKYFSSAEELEWFNNLSLLQQNQAFYQLWCMREATLKASGFGLRKLRSIKINLKNKRIFSSDLSGGKVVFSINPCFYMCFYMSK